MQHSAGKFSLTSNHAFFFTSERISSFFAFFRSLKKIECRNADYYLRTQTKILSISSDRLEPSMKFDWVPKSNTIEHPYKVFHCNSILLDSRTQLYAIVPNRLVKFDCRTVRVVIGLESRTLGCHRQFINPGSHQYAADIPGTETGRFAPSPFCHGSFRPN